MGELFRFYFDGENIEILSLCADSERRCQAHGCCEGPKGSAERHKSSLADDLRTGGFRGRNLVGGLYTRDGGRVKESAGAEESAKTISRSWVPSNLRQIPCWPS